MFTNRHRISEFDNRLTAKSYDSGMRALYIGIGGQYKNLLYISPVYTCFSWKMKTHVDTHGLTTRPARDSP